MAKFQRIQPTRSIKIKSLEQKATENSNNSQTRSTNKKTQNNARNSQNADWNFKEFTNTLKE